MPLITYEFADGHSEEIEVSCEVAQTYAQILKYEKRIKRQDKDRLKSLEKLAEKGFDPPAPNTDVFEIWEKQKQEKAELKQEHIRKKKLARRKKQLEDTPYPSASTSLFFVSVSENQKSRNRKVYGHNRRSRPKTHLKGTGKFGKTTR